MQTQVRSLKLNLFWTINFRINFVSNILGSETKFDFGYRLLREDLQRAMHIAQSIRLKSNLQKEYSVAVYLFEASPSPL